MEFNIAKRSGGKRQIKAPCYRLKKVQKKLSNILYKCEEEIFSKNKLKFISHGFRKGQYSIATNAKYHRNKRYVFNLDLKDFFPSLNFGRVRGFFIKNNQFLLNKEVATVIAQIACYENELPQGSPCSPVISNFIAHILDVRLVGLAKQYGCTYSRYADDLTFSTNRGKFPEQIAGKFCDDKWLVGEELKKEIQRAGFEINPTKTRMQYRQSRQVVTGLIVNQKVNIRSEYYRNARAMCHSLFSKGKFFIPKQKNEGVDKQEGRINQLDGILRHIHFVKNFLTIYAEKKERAEKKKKKEEKKDQDKKKKKGKKDQGEKQHNIFGFDKLYHDFLYYKYFIAHEKPLIICEGETDAVYLKCAVKQLAKQNRNTLSEEVAFFDRSPFARGNKVMRIYEGADSLKNFIAFYEKNIKFYSCFASTQETSNCFVR